MAHLIDPCLRATKIAHGIRRGIDGISPLSGLVPELRILIQEQKNVLTSLKRTAFEKEEAAKHLAIYAKTEGPDISDTLSKLAILIQKAADIERAYSNSLADSRECFKEIRVAEDANFTIRKRKLDLEQKLAVDKTSSSSSSSAHRSSISLASGKAGSINGPQEMHPELKLLRQETMSVENELEDLKRKKIKKATFQQLDALEKMGKELIVIAHYGREVVSHLDDSPTPAGTHADDRFASYDGAAKTTYAVKACMDTFKTWHAHEPQVLISEMDLGDFPKDNKQAMDAMLKDLAGKTGSDWYELQTPTAGTPRGHSRTHSFSSTGSASPRTSMSSVMTTTTYVDGVPTIQVINEIPPTPEATDDTGKELSAANSEVDATAASVIKTIAATQEPVPIYVADSSALNDTHSKVPVDLLPGATATITDGAGDPSPFVPQSTYKPSTTYQAGHENVEGQRSPPSRSRPTSGERFAPHPLLMQQQPQYQQQPLYPPGPPGGALPSQMSMPMPMPMPMPMAMPMPHIPNSPPKGDGSIGDYDGSNRLHSQPISVSFPMRTQQLGPQASSSPDHSMKSGGVTSSSSSHPPRGPHAVLPPTEPGFHIPVGSGSSSYGGGDGAAAVDDSSMVYDGPPPDYAEAAMLPPAEKRDEKKRR